jgi:hypothetical protein
MHGEYDIHSTRRNVKVLDAYRAVNSPNRFYITNLLVLYEVKIAVVRFVHVTNVM